jgi:hypothetical protein
MLLRTTLLAFAALAIAPSAHAAESYDNCVGFIDSLPATISTQGTWCLRKDLATTITMGSAITVATNNVSIDCNGFKVGNLAAGKATQATGLYADDRSNVSVRNCNVRGFLYGIQLGSTGIGGNYRVIGNSVQGSTEVGMYVGGDGSLIAGNSVSDIGGTTYAPIGILAAATVDVLDNSITNVVGQAYAIGIYTRASMGGSLARNRVRGVHGSGAPAAMSIYDEDSMALMMRDNDVASFAGTRAIVCFGTKPRARGNIIVGAATGIEGCGDAGGNYVTP